MYAGGGALIDWLGTRRGFVLIMIWWSLACAGHGLASSFGSLALSRFLLGAGEGAAASPPRPRRLRNGSRRANARRRWA